MLAAKQYRRRAEHAERWARRPGLTVEAVEQFDRLACHWWRMYAREVGALSLACSVVAVVMLVAIAGIFLAWVLG